VYSKLSAGALAIKSSKSEDPIRATSKKKKRKKGKSPNCETVKTFNPALKLTKRKAQCCTSKKEIRLMASQKKSKRQASFTLKYRRAVWENKALKKKIELTPASNSKYSTKKKKQRMRANTSTQRKTPDNSSKQRVKPVFGDIHPEKGDPPCKKKIVSVTWMY
jgi:hypothetical protein